jgi:hypothetical protein
MLLPVVLFVLSACGSTSSPEGVVQAGIDAINARDKAKFVSLCSPDKSEMADYFSSHYVQLPFLTVKNIIVRDSVWPPGSKSVTAQVDYVYEQKTVTVNLTFTVEQLNGSWYIARFVY